MKKSKIRVALAYAGLEMALIVLLFVNALFSYLTLKFADYFRLKRPCLWCSRIDQIFEPDKFRDSFRSLICEDHAIEISKLGFCLDHKKLSDIQTMCEHCLTSSKRAASVAEKFSLVSWMNQIETVDKLETFDLVSEKLSSPWPCSCCDSTIENKFFSPDCNLIETRQEEHDQTSIFDPVCVHAVEKDKTLGETRQEEHDQTPIFDPVAIDKTLCETRQEEDDHTSIFDPVCVTVEKDKTLGETREEEDVQTPILAPVCGHAVEKGKTFGGIRLEEDDQASIFDPVCVHSVEKGITLGETRQEEDDQASIFDSVCVHTVEKDKTLSEETVQTSSVANPVDVGTERGNVIIDTKDCHLMTVHKEENFDCNSVQVVREIQKEIYCELEVDKFETPYELILEESSHFDEKEPLIVENLVAEQTKEVEEISDKTSVVNEAEDVVSIGAEITDQEQAEVKEIFFSKSCNPVDEILVIAEKEKEEVKIVAEEGNSQADIETNEYEDMVPDTPNSIEGFHHLNKKFFSLERRGSCTEDSVEGSTISDMDGSDNFMTIEKLKSALKMERRALNSLYAELEEERNASAVAANQTMAMINRLQEEKAAVQMEALQYQRMMDEQTEYDQEALQLLNELMLKREREKDELERELVFYRKRVEDFESREKMVILKKQKSSNNESGTPTSSSSCSNGEIKDETFGQETGESSCLDGFQEVSNNDAPDESVGWLKDSMNRFEYERLAILEQLKRLEEKLFMVGDGHEEYFENVRPLGDENGHCEESNFMNGSLTGHVGIEDGPVDAHHSGVGSNFVSKPSLDHKKLAIEEEMEHIYERLHTLEADREFLKHCIFSLRKGDKGVQLLQEILHHLRDLRNVELRIRPSEEDPLNLTANKLPLASFP